MTIDPGRWAAALDALGDVEPVLAEVLANLNLRVYPGDARRGDRTAYVVIDLHGVSIGLRRRCFDLYLHLDTTDTEDRLIAFEINGGGETHHPTGPYPNLDQERNPR
ncbi:MAG: hypothetical protein HKP61_00445 [Dactylosporangium sp.]|nr:hypothetical protein [Dactylosporangium sp.]NNJ59441.1 hypothetical protein [Dactylosporangium sp.]